MSHVDLTQDHYQVLGLSVPPQLRSDLSFEDIRTAYRIALLRNHPDKVTTKIIQFECIYTVDQIKWAYKTLSDPCARKAFDDAMLIIRAPNGPPITKPLTGLDKIDLDDLDYDESNNTWSRSCRCGLQKGYIISEEDLESASEHGELVMGCRGCSLNILVAFALAEV